MAMSIETFDFLRSSERLRKQARLRSRRYREGRNNNTQSLINKSTYLFDSHPSAGLSTCGSCRGDDRDACTSLNGVVVHGDNHAYCLPVKDGRLAVCRSAWCHATAGPVLA